MSPTRRTMPETMYRASRVCRVLGNPTAFLIMRALEACPMTPSELSTDVRVPLPTVSRTLRHLREVDLVRYDTDGVNKVYRLKDTAFTAIMRKLEAWVDSVRWQGIASG